MELVMSGQIFQADNSESLPVVAEQICKEADNWGYNYDMEVHYRNVVIWLNRKIFVSCEFEKEKIIEYIVDKYGKGI